MDHLKSVLLRERSQTKMTMYCLTPFIWDVQTGHACRDRREIRGCLGQAVGMENECRYRGRARAAVMEMFSKHIVVVVIWLSEFLEITEFILKNKWILWHVHQQSFFFFGWTASSLRHVVLAAPWHVGSSIPEWGWNSCALYWKMDSQPLDHQGSPGKALFKKKIKWKALEIIFFFGSISKETPLKFTLRITLPSLFRWLFLWKVSENPRTGVLSHINENNK